MARTASTARSEHALLEEFLGYQRQSLIGKLSGLTDEQARRTPTVSSLSVLSVVKHSAIWERRWFQAIFAGRRSPDEWPASGDEPADFTFALDDADTVESVIADYRAQIAVSNEILGGADLDTACTWPDMADKDLRWVALHMIEETARHAGHVDIIRESIDGSQGR